jgi:outer membrane receptor protein involved in Fe transport
LSRGYKPGGFNPPINPTFQDTSSFTFASEKVDAIEIGSKNVFLDGTLVLNGSIFYYDYKDLQVAQIRNNSSLNENIDTNNWGIELETVWTPDRLPNLQIDAAYSYLNTDIQNAETLDPLNRTAGDPDLITLKNIDLGSATGVNYVAPTAQVLPVVPAALADLGALSAQNGTTVAGTDYPNGIPAYFSRTYLDAACGGCTSEGVETNIDGNSLPNSPENTIHIGAQYTFNIRQIFGSLTARLDYYWQDKMYGREFNTRGDEIDSWDQFNASLIYESDNGNWRATFWARNLEDEDNVTGHYLTSDTSGLYRNYFLTEPRLYGASVRYMFGGG